MDRRFLTDNLQYYPGTRRYVDNATVFQGSYNNILVAVRKIDISNDGIMRRIEKDTVLRQSIERIRPENIAGFYCMYVPPSRKECYMATELCDGTLNDYVQNKTLQVSYADIQIFKDITQGVEILHSEKATCIELAPGNIYFKLKPGQNIIHKFLLCDFSASMQNSGTLQFEEKKMVDTFEDTRKDDISHLGCLFYFVATRGRLLFGLNQIAQIAGAIEPYLDQIQNDPLKHLIRTMTCQEKNNRPNTKMILSHPALWTAEQTRHNLIEIDGRLTKLFELEGDDAFHDLETPGFLDKEGWLANLPTNFKDHLTNNYNQYKDQQHSLRGLLKAIRNIEAHYHELPEAVQAEIGANWTDRMRLWNKVCPQLLMKVYSFCQDKAPSVSEPEEVQMEVDDEPRGTEADTFTGYDMRESMEFMCIQAAAKGNLDRLKSLREQGISMECADYDGRTPLHLAATEGQEDIIIFLLHECDVDPNKRDRWENTARDVAVQAKKQNIVTCIDAIDKTRCRELEFIHHASLGALALVKRHKAAGVDMEAADYDGRTALHLAAARGHESVVRFLLECAVNPDKKDTFQKTACDEAKANNHTDIVALFDVVSKSRASQ